MRIDMLHIEMFQALVATGMEQYHDSYNLRILQLRSPIILSLPAVSLWRQAVYFDEFVINFAEIIRHTEYFSNFVLVIIMAIVFVVLIFMLI